MQQTNSKITYGTRLTSAEDTYTTDFLKHLSHDITSIQQLEFSKILASLFKRLSTPFGPAKLEQANFSWDRAAVQAMLQEVSEMIGLIESGEHIPLTGFVEIRHHLDRIKPQDAYLDADVLLEIKGNLQLMGELSGFFNRQKENVPGLNRYAARVHYHRNIVREIENKIDTSGEIFDNASPELRQIRIKIRSLASDQTRMLRNLQKRYSDYSQDDIVTLRDGRQVLGIIPSFVSKVNGIVHGTSSTGATVFVEPMETLKLSNEVQNLRIKEKTEIIKILRKLTGMIREIRDDLFYGLDNVGVLDLIYAKARLARDLKGVVPKIADHPFLKLSESRHPLLIRKLGHENVVPLDIEISAERNTLLITGPNAGGKTVAMKTVGLVLMMVQMGLPIPAKPDSEIPLLSNILVDIGDRQSLEQDLSTFSAHVVRLSEILEKADGESLVLLDEAGTGTDPKEGAALAIAMLKELTSRGTLTIATTHHGELKAFAHEDEQVENCSMEFNLETLEPTYRLRMGVPGSSYAIEIARRYGLPEKLISGARTYIGGEKDRLEELIFDLEQQIQRYEKDKHQLSIKLSEAAAMEQLYQRQSEQLKQNKAELKRAAAAEAQKIIQDANATIERVVREIRESNAEKSTTKAARDAVSESKAALDKLLEKPRKKPKKSTSTALSKGDIVHVDSLNTHGELLENPKGKKRVRVQVGNVTMTLDVNGIRKSAKQNVDVPVKRQYSGKDVDTLGGPSVGPELDLRGLDAEKAIEETDLYLNKVWESDWTEVRIVHGKGTGILRQRVNQFLSRDKRVASKRLGKWGEGDTGVTVVTLRKND